MTKSLVFPAGALLAAALVMAGCQTTKPALASAPASTVRVEEAGFAPEGSQQHALLSIDLQFGEGPSIKDWTVSIESGGTAVKNWTGTAAYLPASLSWDGMDDKGSPAPEGAYTAQLSATYQKTYVPSSVQSTSFVLDRTPPTGSITLTPDHFTSTDSGVAGPVTLTISASSKVASVASWSLGIYDIAGGLVKSFDGQWPSATATWDGSSLNGGYVSPGMTYSAVATVTDVYGLSARVKTSVQVAALPVPAPAAAASAPAPAAAPAAPTPATPGAVSVTPGARGFSPNADGVADTISFGVAWGQPASITTWNLAIVDSGMRVVKTLTGSGANPPATLSWDGKTDAGTVAPDDSYTAALSVSYGAGFSDAAAKSTPFLLVTSVPTGTIRLSDVLFSPVEGNPTITLTVDASAANAAIDSWTMEIDDPAGNAFRSFAGKWPVNSATWDGKGAKGDLVQSAEDYPVVAKVRDEFGNTAALKTVLPVDILVEKTATGYRILASRIFFKAFTADYTDVAADLASQNSARLDDLAKKLAKFPGYRIRLVGHAVSIYWDNPALGKAEQQDVLIPLSKARADAVMKALVARGLDETRFTTEGVGASDQLVPDSNLKDRWQNRRVALFLERQ